MTAPAALDRSVVGGTFSICGDEVSFKDVADTSEAQSGKRFVRHSLKLSRKGVRGFP
jgi:hypothetical protein